MSRGAWPWSALGIDPTGDVKAVRKAYADKLKAMDVDRDAAAFEVLRNARDAALEIARGETSAPAVSDDDWSVTLGRESDEDGDFDDDDFDPDFADLPPEPASYGPIDIPPEEFTGDGPDYELTVLLFLNGELSDVPFDAAEEQAARAAMRQIIAGAHEGDLARQEMADHWLADRLASSWPRSAPLLAEAAEAFEWEKRHGQLGEGGAQAFITARLKGMRFCEAVERPGHWGNGAWRELSNPVKKSWWQATRANKAECRLLIGHIREHHPELESLLDWEKVADLGQEGDGSAWWWVGRAVIGLFIMAQVLRFCGGDTGNEPGYPDQVAAETAWTLEQGDVLAVELFGPGTSFAELVADAPELGQVIKSQSGVPGYAPTTEAVTQDMIAWVRAITIASYDKVDFDRLVRIKQLKLDFLDLAYDQGGPAACIGFMEELRLPPMIEVPSALREDERLLAAQMLQDGLFDPSPPSPPISAPIPGELFAAAEKASGVSGEAATSAAKDDGPDRERCLFRKALLAEVLRRPGTVSRELLLLL